MHVPGWHEATKDWQEAGDIQMVGIIQEQHPDRARLFMQWKKMGWPIMVDSLNLLDMQVVPLTLAIDEHGVIRQIQPPRDELAELRASFVDVDFDPASAAAAKITPSPAEEMFLWGDDSRIDDIVDAFEHALVEDLRDGDGEGKTLFRTGVAYRRRHDSPYRRQGDPGAAGSPRGTPSDFQSAVIYWERALKVDPNNYIWRRRIQQYGPRLDKPYPFYDWVPTAREEITARGETPAALVAEPGGAEFAEPLREFAAEAGAIEPPDPDGRIYRDDARERYVNVEDAAMVPTSTRAGASARAHLTFVPNEAIKAHWNNEVDGLVFWIEDIPEGWQVDRRLHSVPNPPDAVSLEPRKVEFEVKTPDGATPGTYEVAGYALYYVCEDVNGVCLYRRQDLSFTVGVHR